MDAKARRQVLGDFLRTRRARLSPADVGLPPGLRRRAPGLRREEVAQLANIGTSWYTALEQGRDVHPSEQVLEGLAQALRLTLAERQHLFLLALQHIPAGPLPSEEQLSPALHAVVHALDPHPTYVMGRRWDLLVWNRAAEQVFTFRAIRPPHVKNLVWRFFTTPALKENHADWDQVAQGVIAQFRADSARYPGDAWFAEVIDDLQHTSAEFREWWSQHDVHYIPHCHKVMQHPALGRLEFEQVALQVPENPDLKMVIYTAFPATAATLEQLLHTTADA
jgi:transcriptional regulator with XRE-family HTH domain